MKILIFFLLMLFQLNSLAALNNINGYMMYPPKGSVALMFDDGPSPVSTLKILEVLNKYHVKATFNLIGYYAENFPGLVRAIAKQGHAIGNHSLSHLDMKRITKRASDFEIKTATQIIEKIIHRKLYCFQPPYLRTSYQLGEAAQDNDLSMLPKPVESFDYLRISTRQLIKHTIKSAKSGTIILLHENRPRTIAALPEIIKGIRRKGLKFATICMPRNEKKNAKHKYK